MSAEIQAIERKLQNLRLMDSQQGRVYGPQAWILVPSKEGWDFWAAFASVRGAVRFFDRYAPAGAALASMNHMTWEIDFNPTGAGAEAPADADELRRRGE